MLQPRGEQRLAHEASLLPLVPHQQLLDRHRAIEPAIAGPQDAADAALRDLLADDVGVARDLRERRRVASGRGRALVRARSRCGEGVRVAERVRLDVGAGRWLVRPALAAVRHAVLRPPRGRGDGRTFVLRWPPRFSEQAGSCHCLVRGRGQAAASRHGITTSGR
ncbi:hypothetical protein OV203_32760 [Nannocystis sp. ILAH1]|uniref:hypothetical protein n=1 Tax=Nannocystis sp. ILAH1 TaxID=2996789 RepID=UPI0022715A26|nr:hypothetical protein [Nannocystis sp. ILAH1]MCY0991955.1 hypothetical protein [Nannocystis sp. ILAH1]